MLAQAYIPARLCKHKRAHTAQTNLYQHLHKCASALPKRTQNLSRLALCSQHPSMTRCSTQTCVPPVPCRSSLRPSAKYSKTPQGAVPRPASNLSPTTPSQTPPISNQTKGLVPFAFLKPYEDQACKAKVCKKVCVCAGRRLHRRNASSSRESWLANCS